MNTNEEFFGVLRLSYVQENIAKIKQLAWSLENVHEIPEDEVVILFIQINDSYFDRLIEVILGAKKDSYSKTIQDIEKQEKEPVICTPMKWSVCNTFAKIFPNHANILTAKPSKGKYKLIAFVANGVLVQDITPHLDKTKLM